MPFKISTSVAVQKFNIKELYKCTEVKFIDGLIKKSEKSAWGEGIDSIPCRTSYFAPG